MSAFSNNIFDLLNEDGFKPAPVAAPVKETNKPTEAKPASNDKRTKSNGGNAHLSSLLYTTSMLFYSPYSTLHLVHDWRHTIWYLAAMCWQRGKTENEKRHALVLWMEC